MKDPNFEFLSSWNSSDYDDSVYEHYEPVTEMTDDQLLKLGFPAPNTPDHSDDTLNKPPPDSVINNPFITFVSRKYWSTSLLHRQVLHLTFFKTLPALLCCIIDAENII